MKKLLNWLISLFYEKRTTEKESKPMTNKIGIVVITNSVSADGISQILAKLKVTDDAGSPVGGATVNLDAGAATVQLSGITDVNGELTVPVTSKTPGPVTLTATMDGGVTASDSSLYFVAVPQPAVAAAVKDKEPDVDMYRGPLAILKAKATWIEARIAELGKDAEEELAAIAEKFIL